MADYQYINQYSSGNYTPAAKVKAVFGRPRKITAITIHHWGIKGQKFQNVVNYLCRKNGNTSAHYVVEAGKVACIVDPDNAAWHAGNAVGNATSIGIECRPEATAGDYETVAALIRDLRKVYGDVPLVKHSDWKNTACPGQWDLAKLDRMARAETKPTAKPKPEPKPKPVDKGNMKEFDVWAFRNPKIEKRDAYAILRGIDKKLDRIIKKIGA